MKISGELKIVRHIAEKLAYVYVAEDFEAEMTKLAIETACDDVGQLKL